MNKLKILTTILSIILLICTESVFSACEDWTLCHRVRCAAPPETCPKGQLLVWDDCGCCQRCDKPKVTPCGVCGINVKCKESYPICPDNNVVTIDSCGCCKVCKKLLGNGADCSNDFVGVCKPDLKCVDGICRPRSQTCTD